MNIYPDVTVILERYCDWDYIVRNKYLRYAAALIKQNERIVYKDIEYHLIDDLKCDLEAECFEQVEQ